MPLRYAKHISGFVQCDLDMCRTGVVLDSAVSIVTQDRHGVCSLFHIGITGTALVEIGLEVFIELVVLQKQRHHSHHDGGTVLCALVELVVFDGLRVVIIDTGHDIAGSAVKHNQMVHIRTGGGFILSHSAVVDGADSAFSSTHHTVTNCMDSLDHGAGQRSLRCTAILGGDFHLLVCQLIERLR